MPHLLIDMPIPARRRATRHAMKTIVLLTAGLTTHRACGQAIEVTALACAVGVHLVAKDAPVRDVVAQLARTQRFRVEADEPVTNRVTIDSIQSTQRLLTTVLQDRNSIVAEEPDPACPGRSRVTAIWILGRNSAPSGAPNVQSGPRTAPSKTEAYVTPEAKEQDDLYRRGHGMLPE